MNKLMSILVLFILLSVSFVAIFSSGTNAEVGDYYNVGFNNIVTDGNKTPFTGNINVIMYLNKTSPFILHSLESYIESYKINFNVSKNLNAIFLAGNAFNFESMFNDHAYLYKNSGKSYYAFSSPLLPAQFNNTVYWISGLNNYTSMDTNLYQSLNVISGPYNAYELRYAYDVTPFISTGDEGQGNTIAIIDAYGDPSLSSDLAYFSSYFKLPAVNYTVIYPFGTPNTTKSGWMTETAIDVECAFSMAPKAKFLVVITPNDSSSLEEAVSYVIDNDLANIISISWGAPESSLYDPGFHNAFVEASSENITVVAASGDNGSSTGVEYPASDPYVTAVGATALYMQENTYNSYTTYTYDYENAWSKSGGGYSTIFKAPQWQHALGFNSTMRGVPDIAFVGSPSTPVQGYINGTMDSVGGTSVSTPLFAGMVADLNTYYSHPLGYINPYLYSAYNYNNSNNYFHEITNGSNGAYNASNGWTPITGLGSLDLYNTVLHVKNLNFEVGSESSIEYNNGISASIRTEYGSTPANITDYFWIGENVSNVGFVKFGYFLNNVSSGLFIHIYNYTTNIFNYTDIMNLGNDNILNNYTILFNSDSISFYFNNFLILNESYRDINDYGYNGLNIYFAIAQTKNVLSTYSPLGPVEFKGFKFIKNGTWISLPEGSLFKYSSENFYSAYSALEIPFTNDDFLAGLLYQDSSQSNILWPYSLNYTESLPLHINNNSLDIYNGVYPGSGTKADPYRITGYDFTSSSIELTITDIKEYVVISNNIFNGSLIGIYVKDSKNIIIENNTFENNDIALFLRDSYIPAIFNNSFDHNDLILIGYLSTANLKNNAENSNLINYIPILSNFSGVGFIQFFTPLAILLVIVVALIVILMILSIRKKHRSR